MQPEYTQVQAQVAPVTRRRWQQPYDHLPHDAYLCGHRAEYLRVSAGIGPHQNREMGLMLAGLKPVAMLEYHRARHWLPVALQNGWHVDVKQQPRQPHPAFLFSLPGQRWRAQAILRVYQGVERRGSMTPACHARVGLLLGYTKQDVRLFLEQFK